MMMFRLTRRDRDEGDILRADTRSRGRTKGSGLFGDLGGSGLGGLGGGAEGLIDGDIDKGIEMGIRLLAGNLVEEVLDMTNPPLESSVRMVFFDGVSKALGRFDEFAVGLAGLGPLFGEMVGVEFVEARVTAGRTDHDALFALLAFFDGIKGSPEGFDTGGGDIEIAYTFGMRCGTGRMRYENGHSVAKSVHNLCSQKF